MDSARAQGYQASFSGLRRRSSQADFTTTFLWDLRDRLADTFYQEGNPLGDDQYGVELERNRYKIEDSVFGAFDSYIQGLQYLRDGLGDNARNYQDAEDIWDPGYEVPGGYEGTQDIPDVSLNDVAGADPPYPQGG
ncbi:hypothetical protein [Streptosporangium roseum]|uniref:hypothetical protein n=1 Tax=Streptosporangium roseum TaxID=2001 RepID=UPI003324C74A